MYEFCRECDSPGPLWDGYCDVCGTVAFYKKDPCPKCNGKLKQAWNEEDDDGMDPPYITCSNDDCNYNRYMFWDDEKQTWKF